MGRRMEELEGKMEEEKEGRERVSNANKTGGGACAKKKVGGKKSEQLPAAGVFNKRTVHHNESRHVWVGLCSHERLRSGKRMYPRG